MKISDMLKIPHIPQWWEKLPDDYKKDFPNEEFHAPLSMLTNPWHDFAPELQLEYGRTYEGKKIIAPRFNVKVHFDEYIDCERCCVIASAWLDTTPFMIFRFAGRSGHDLYDRFVFDVKTYKEFIAYITSLIPEREVKDVVNVDDDIKELDEFYGYEFTA